MKIDFAIIFYLCIVFEKIGYYPIEYGKILYPSLLRQQ